MGAIKHESRLDNMIFHKSTDYADAELWDIQQQISMTPDERQTVARELRIRVYGAHPPDVRESHLKNS